MMLNRHCFPGSPNTGLHPLTFRRGYLPDFAIRKTGGYLRKQTTPADHSNGEQNMDAGGAAVNGTRCTMRL